MAGDRQGMCNRRGRSEYGSSPACYTATSLQIPTPLALLAAHTARLCDRMALLPLTLLTKCPGRVLSPSCHRRTTSLHHGDSRGSRSSVESQEFVTGSHTRRRLVMDSITTTCAYPWVGHHDDSPASVASHLNRQISVSQSTDAISHVRLTFSRPKLSRRAITHRHLLGTCATQMTLSQFRRSLTRSDRIWPQDCEITTSDAVDLMLGCEPGARGSRFVWLLRATERKVVGSSAFVFPCHTTQSDFSLQCWRAAASLQDRKQCNNFVARQVTPELGDCFVCASTPSQAARARQWFLKVRLLITRFSFVVTYGRQSPSGGVHCTKLWSVSRRSHGCEGFWRLEYGGLCFSFCLSYILPLLSVRHASAYLLSLFFHR